MQLVIHPLFERKRFSLRKQWRKEGTISNGRKKGRSHRFCQLKRTARAGGKGKKLGSPVSLAEGKMSLVRTHCEKKMAGRQEIREKKRKDLLASVFQTNQVEEKRGRERKKKHNTEEMKKGGKERRLMPLDPEHPRARSCSRGGEERKKGSPS